MDRGPYKGKKYLLKRAEELRSNGVGYKEIGKILGGTSSSTIFNWTKGIKVEGVNAYIRAGAARKLPFDGLKSKSAIRERLILVRGHKCEECGLGIWNSKPIVLETHHIDGDKRNNASTNLSLLCPNCHSQTDNYKNNTRK